MGTGSIENLSVHFSDFFDVSPAVLEEYGAFDVSLVNDLPLFVDPFLLFNSSDPQLQGLHEEIIRYMRFLKDRAVEGAVDRGLLRTWFMFPEVKQNWFGFSLGGIEDEVWDRTSRAGFTGT